MVADAPERVELYRDIPGIGRLEFVETDKRREYWLLAEGNTRRRRLPSVTGIIRDTWPKPALLEWYAREPNASAILAGAAIRGKAVHRFIETYMASGDLLPFSDFEPEHRGYLQGAARFLWECQPKPIAIERLVCHPEHGYAGRLDLIAGYEGGATLFDFKSNPEGRVYPEAHVQAQGYALADHRCGGQPIDAIVIVGISESGQYRLVPGHDAKKLWAECLSYYGEMKRFLKGLE